MPLGTEATAVVRLHEVRVGERLPTLQGALDAFLLDLTLEGRSPATVKTYRALLKFDDEPLLSLTPTICRQMIGDRLKRQAHCTAQTFSGALAAFGAYIALVYGVSDPMKGVPKPRKKERPHTYLSRQELAQLWQACPDDSYRLMMLLLMEGVRAAEACALKHEDISGDTAHILGKGSKPRRIALSGPLRALLEGGSGPVLGYTTSRLRARVRYLAKVAGLKRRIHPHLFRHSMATHHLLEGSDALTVMQLGGWADERMLKHYAKSALEESALAKARALDLTSRLLGE